MTETDYWLFRKRPTPFFGKGLRYVPCFSIRTLSGRRIDMKCPHCSYVARGDTEEDVKSQLMQHCQTMHKMNRKDFEIMFGDMRELAMLFTPSSSKSK